MVDKLSIYCSRNLIKSSERHQCSTIPACSWLEHGWRVSNLKFPHWFALSTRLKNRCIIKLDWNLVDYYSILLVMWRTLVLTWRGEEPQPWYGSHSAPARSGNVCEGLPQTQGWAAQNWGCHQGGFFLVFWRSRTGRMQQKVTMNCSSLTRYH